MAYKWIALSNTTVGVLLATINQSIVIISLPAIFRGVGVDPLAPDNTSYLLWMLMGYLLRGAGGHARTARRHARPGPHLQPRLRGVHRLLGAAVGRSALRAVRSGLADRLAGRAGRRRGDADGQLDR